MDEMDDIAKAAGYNVVGHVTQHREAIDAAYCIGEGKQGHSCDVLVFLSLYWTKARVHHVGCREREARVIRND